MGSSIPCRICGTPFIRTANNTLCSAKCQIEAKRIRWRNRQRHRQTQRVCLVCGQGFMSTQWIARYCSQDCITVAHGKTSCPILKPCRDCGAAIPSRKRLCGACLEQHRQDQRIGPVTLPCFFCKDPVALPVRIAESNVRCTICQAIRDSRHLMDLLPPEGDLPIEYVRTVQKYRRAHKEIQNGYQRTRQD